MNLEENHALLIDLDGTLADSLPVMYQIYSEFLANFNGVASREEFESLNGVPLRKSVEVLAQTHKIPGDLGTLLALYQKSLGTFYDRVQPTLGAGKLFAAARSLRWKIAVVTSSLHPHAETWVMKNGLGPVDLVVGGDDVSKGKPDPEPFSMAAQKLYAYPKNCIAVEDSKLGLQSAVAAGTRAFLYSPTNSRAHDFNLANYPGAKGVLENLEDLIPRLELK